MIPVILLLKNVFSCLLFLVAGGTNLEKMCVHADAQYIYILSTLTWQAWPLSVASELKEEPGTSLEPDELDQIKVKVFTLMTCFSHFNSEKV